MSKSGTKNQGEITQGVKTDAQKKWAVKTRPFGREAHSVTRDLRVCKQFAQPLRLGAALTLSLDRSRPVHTV